MALNCGIVGLPNVGKSTIFSALSGSPAEAANYAFCTIDPNRGRVGVPDPRLAHLAAVFAPKSVVPAGVDFVDIAGLVRGASKGEGLGNQFLSHIREVGVIAHVVRCFDDPDIIHVNNMVDPDSDMETIAVELALADLETLAKRRTRAEHSAKSLPKPEQRALDQELAVLAKIEPALSNGIPARSLGLSLEEVEAVSALRFITMKPQLYVCNVDEAGMRSHASGGLANAYVEAVFNRAAAEGAEALVLCGKYEAELAGLEDEAERTAFLAELGLRESGLSALIASAYRLLGLRTFFTAGADECRAWTIRAGETAPQAAGAIHSDFEKGFIKAEVYSFEDLLACGSEAKIKEAGKYRLEGREYAVRDGDVMFFKFNV
jgi:GTP-binding protein YchF